MEEWGPRWFGLAGLLKKEGNPRVGFGNVEKGEPLDWFWSLGMTRYPCRCARHSTFSSSFHYWRLQLAFRYIEVFAASYGEMVQFCDEHRLRVPRGSGGGYGGGMAPARGGFEDAYSGYGAFGRAGGDRAAPVPAPWDDRGGAPSYGGAGAPSYGGAPAPMADPFSGYNSSWAGAADARRPASPNLGTSYADPYGRANLTDPYGRAVPTADPYGRPAVTDYGRPAVAEDPYMRGGGAPRRTEDLFGRRPEPYESFPRATADTWRGDERGAPPAPGAGYTDSWAEYGYSSSGGGGPIRVRDQWRERDDTRGSSASAPRGRERPGQKYTLKMRGVPFRAIEADIYDVSWCIVVRYVWYLVNSCERG